MDIEGLGVPDVVRAPHAIDDLSPSEHAARVADEQLEQVEFLERHRESLATHRHDVAIHVDAHRPGLKDTRQHFLRLAAATQDGPDTRDKLTGGKRLGDVVIGTELEADDLVDLTVLGRDHDDGHRRSLTQRAADLGAGDAGQHEVQQHEIRPVPVELIQSGGTVSGDADLVALTPQHEGQRIGEGLLVFHH